MYLLIGIIIGLVIGAAAAWWARSSQIEHERAHAAALRREADGQWALRLEAVKQELLSRSASDMARTHATLEESNRQQLSELMAPLKEQFEAFRRSVDESRTQSQVSKKAIEDTFEAALKLFQQQQDQAVRALQEETARIGHDAANLTNALRSGSKAQGNWGELVLETLLENSGLRKDEEYFTQQCFKDSKGNVYFTDVVVRFPEGRCIIIDSKVSLTAYADSVNANDDKERERLLREHVASMRRHVDELAAKKYDRIVDQAIGFVLMFVPNESAYIAAIKHQPDLSREAYGKRIIIISPSNLLMALQLAYNLWQYDRQGKNVERIVKSAADLYDKVANFQDTFDKVGDAIDQLRRTFDLANNRLYEGKGSIYSRVENLKEMGVTPSKRLKS